MPAFFEEKSWTDKIKTIFWVVIIIGVALVAYTLIRGENLLIRNSDAFQAVFLDNDQVYFGKLQPVDGEWVALTDIYYLRAGTVQNIGSGQEGSPQVDLIKLGQELHGPRDEMIIHKTHILFYEDLTEQGQVMQLIRQHKGQ